MHFTKVQHKYLNRKKPFSLFLSRPLNYTKLAHFYIIRTDKQLANDITRNSKIVKLRKEKKTGLKHNGSSKLVETYKLK